MRHSSLVTAITFAAVLCAESALAQTGDNTTTPSTATPSTTTPSTTPPSTTPPASVPASDQASTQATTATGTADAKLAAIRERALATSEKDKKAVDTKLDITKAAVDGEAASKGDNVVAGRLATEFGMTADALTAEKAQYNTGWGDLMIAHSLQANAKTAITLDQLFQMRTDGMGWGQIANGLGLRLGEVVSAVKSEGSVATGRTKPDGKVATIHSGGASGTHSASTHAHAGAGAAAASMHGHAGK